MMSAIVSLASVSVANRRYRTIGFNEINQVIRLTAKFFRRRFGSANIKILIYLARITGNNFKSKLLCQLQRDRRLAYCSRTDQRRD